MTGLHPPRGSAKSEYVTTHQKDLIMLRRGRHRASKQCFDHLSELVRAKRDLQWFKDQCRDLNKEADRLRAQLIKLQSELGTESPTAPVPVVTDSPAMIKAHTPQGFTILLPVGNRRTRRVRPVPSWALRD